MGGIIWSNGRLTRGALDVDGIFLLDVDGIPLGTLRMVCVDGRIGFAGHPETLAAFRKILERGSAGKKGSDSDNPGG